MMNLEYRGRVWFVNDYVEGSPSSVQVDCMQRLSEWAPDWFVWGPKCTVGRERKSPRQPEHVSRLGRVNDAATAGSLVQALESVNRNACGGVGLLVNTGRPGLVGIDLDNVIHAGELHSLGAQALEAFADAYVEISPSGTGLRIFCLGQIPDGTPQGSTAMEGVHGGVSIKFEIYGAGGAGRFLRVTGAAVHGTGGVVVAAQAGIDWLSLTMRDAKGSIPGNTDDRERTAAEIEPLQSLDKVFEALSSRRTAVTAEVIASCMKAESAAKPRSKLSEALRGNLGPWNGDHSAADLFACCEAVRRGADNEADVIDVWTTFELSKRPKFKRKDYQRVTVERAARTVLASQKDGKGKAPKGELRTLDSELSAALAKSGDTLTFTSRGLLVPDAGNVVVLFRNVPAIAGLLAFNALTQRPERRGSWAVFDRLGAACEGMIDDDDITRVGMWLGRTYRMQVERKELWRGLDAAARDATFDPLRERLLELRTNWDGVPRVGTWLRVWMHADSTVDGNVYLDAVGRCFLVGAVARAMSPGCQMDTVLAIEGSGGGGKSTAFKVLSDAVALGLFVDGVQDVSSPQSLVEGTGGRWIVELAELAGVRRAADVEALKAAITRTTDVIRRPYDVMSKELHRRFVFVATTNRTEYLSDPSGALLRRFWTVRTLATELAPIDRDALAEVAPQLWGEAVALYEAGARWHLSPEDGEAFTQWTSSREMRREDGAFHEELVSLLVEWVMCPSERRSLKEIAEAVGDSKSVEGDQSAQNRLAGSLRSLGMESHKVNGVKRWGFTTKAANQFDVLRLQAARGEVRQVSTP